uniref:RNA polymerase II-associated protein 3 n=1 Tax=Tetranychus urticae TaxID=32264 RepID=T1JVA2_TETUR
MSNPNALAEKEKGNQFFKEKNYESAVNCYSKAIEYDRTNHLLYGNRSQAYLNLNRPDEAVKDCNQALKLDSNYVKGYLRRGTALKMLSDYEKALTDFKKVLQLEPNNKQALKEVQDINELLSPKKAGLIEPISSSDTFYSNNKQIETLPSGDEKQSNRLNVRPSSKKSLPISNRVINRIPINTFEFYCDWRELSTDSTKLNYITNIGVTKMREIFRDSMEPFILPFDQICYLNCPK